MAPGRRPPDGRRRERRAATAGRLRRELELGAAVFENAAEGIVVTEADGRIVSVNGGFERITGFSSAEILGDNPRILSSGRHDTAFYTEMWRSLLEEGQWAGEIWNRRRSGEIYPEWLSIRAVRDPHGRITNFVGVFSDISERKANEERIRFLAHHDPLTELPNRLLLADRLQQAARLSERARRKVGVALLDLDRFKAVNDVCGHAAGDLVLQEVSRRLAATLREGDTVGRFGGDEFVLVLPSLRASEDAGRIAEKCLEVLSQPLFVTGIPFQLGASIGLAVYPDDGRETDELLRRADVAMYQAKQSGGGCFRFYGADLNLRALEALSLESRLRRGIAEGELEARFAPRLSLAGALPTGLVLRPAWNHPEHGRLGPEAFYPIAERRGLGRPLAEWLLGEATRTAIAVHRAGRAHAEGPPLAPMIPLPPVVVALPRFVLEQPELTASLSRVFDGLPPGALELELPVDLLGGESRLAVSFGLLRSLGLRLSVGDVGFAPLPLDALARLVPDRLTIAPDPARSLAIGSHEALYLRSLAGICGVLGLQLAASRVERREQLDALGRVGVQEADGEAIGGALSAAELRGWPRRGEVRRFDIKSN